MHRNSTLEFPIYFRITELKDKMLLSAKSPVSVYSQHDTYYTNTEI